MKRILSTYALIFVVVLILGWCATAHCQTVAPFQGLGNVQFFDNSGSPLTAGVLYSFIAGTSTQQATFTDSTGLIQNPNPIPFGTGARVGIWLTSGALYKFVLCLKNDGPFCAAGDVLFSVDQVPATSSGSGAGGGGSPFLGTFISGSPTPATGGILRLASGDTVCYRNTANSANLCWRKDVNDLLSWDGGAFKLPEVSTPSCSLGFDIIWADNVAHRFETCANGAGRLQLVAAGQDINNSDQVVGLHFGSTALPLGSTPPLSVQNLCFNGSNVTGCGPTVIYSTPSSQTTTSIGSTTMATPGGTGTFRFSYYATQTALGVGCSTNSTFALQFTYTDPNAGSSANINFVGQAITANGTVGQMIGFGALPLTTIVVRTKAGQPISYSVTYTSGTCTTPPTYQVFPILEELTVN